MKITKQNNCHNFNHADCQLVVWLNKICFHLQFILNTSCSIQFKNKDMRSRILKWCSKAIVDSGLFMWGDVLYDLSFIEDVWLLLLNFICRMTSKSFASSVVDYTKGVGRNLVSLICRNYLKQFFWYYYVFVNSTVTFHNWTGLMSIPQLLQSLPFSESCKE